MFICFPPNKLENLVLFLISWSPRPSASLPAGPPPQVSPDEAEQQAVHLLACSADMLPASLPPINMFDLLEALQVRTMSSQIFFLNLTFASIYLTSSRTRHVFGHCCAFSNCHYIVCPAECTHDTGVNTGSSYKALGSWLDETSANEQPKKRIPRKNSNIKSN